MRRWVGEKDAKGNLCREVEPIVWGWLLPSRKQKGCHGLFGAIEVRFIVSLTIAIELSHWSAPIGD